MGDVWLTAGLGVVVLGVVAVFYRQLLVTSFDPIFATTLRLRVEVFRLLLLVVLALTIVVSLQTVGVGLVAAMLVTPAATSYLLVRRLLPMMVLAAGLGAVSAVAGLYISYYADVASGAAVVLTATALFFAAFLFAPQRGAVWRLLRKR